MKWMALLVAGCGAASNGDGGALDAAIDVAMAPPDIAERPDDLSGPDFATPLPTGSDYSGCMGSLDLTQAASANVVFGGGLGNHYKPQCVTVQIGEPVNWMGDFTIDPLAFASTNITKVTPTVISATLESVTFVQPGYFGYYSKAHGTDDGLNMAGLVRVVQ